MLILHTDVLHIDKEDDIAKKTTFQKKTTLVKNVPGDPADAVEGILGVGVGST